MGTLRVLVPVLVAASAATAPAQVRPGAPARRPPAPVTPSTVVLPGYARTLAGATIAYHSPHPDAQSALLARALRGVRSVSWETAPVPPDLTADTVAFVWVMGLSGSKGVRRFELAVDGGPRFAFATAGDSLARGFETAGPGGSSFAFRVTTVDRYGDLFGYATLRLARAAVAPGRAVRLEVQGEDADSRAWYMTFQHRLMGGPRIAQNPVLVRRGGGAEAQLRVTVDDVGGGGEAVVEVAGQAPVLLPLAQGGNVVAVPAGAVETARDQRVAVRVRGTLALDTVLRLQPVSRRDFYVLPYSHNDIGYSDHQSRVEEVQHRNLDEALRLIERTRDYPAEARYRWNVEILWPLESWLRRASAADRARLAAAVREGSVGLGAFLGGVQSGMATLPEMNRFFDLARLLRERDSLPVEAAVISDIPGQSWGVVTALRQSGIRWLALAPNSGDRIGFILEDWGDRPFWWTSPSGRDSVLTWVAGSGYSLFHDALLRQDGERKLHAVMRRLEAARSPYDIVQLPYTINGDNGPNDPGLSDFVRDWNERYVSPRLVVATHARLFRDFEERYGRTLHSAGGDFTTYWDDGIASSAAEVALVRRASDRLVQAEAIWAMRDKSSFPADSFAAAWREVVLWDEHTWGAAASVESPDAPEVLAQWEYKRGFAVRADSLSRLLMARSLEVPFEGTRRAGPPEGVPDAIEVYNTSSWPRTEVVFVPAELSRAGDRVEGPDGRPVPSQRLSRGQLAVLVRELPPLTGRRYTVRSGAAWAGDVPPVRAGGAVLESDRLRLTVDTVSGAVASLVWKPAGLELVDRSARRGLGEYFYVAGRDSSAAAGVTGPRIQARENGPLVASLTVYSQAPGARALLREVTLFSGFDRVDLTAVIDKRAVREKEGVHLVFPFRVPDGRVRFDVAAAVVRPDSEQLRGSLRNFVSVQSWADVSNDSVGVTWATPSAPLVEVGGMFAELPWMRSIPRTQTLLSYAMNNYWHTNFRAEQEGPVAFQYSLRPHQGFRPEDAVRHGAERRSLLVVAPAHGAPPLPSLFTLPPGPVVATAVRPTRDGSGWLISLYNPSDVDQPAAPAWRRGERVAMWVSDAGEARGTAMAGVPTVPARGTLVLRVERAAPAGRR